MVRVDRDVAGVPGVGEPNSGNNGESKESAKEDLCRAREQLISDG